MSRVVRPLLVGIALTFFAIAASVSVGDEKVTTGESGDKPAASSGEQPSKPADIIQDEPSFLVHVKVDRDDHRYREGEPLRVSIVSEEDAYAYVLYQQADGHIYQIFPNSAQRDNRVTAKQAVEVPATGDLFRWAISPPFGDEVVKVIATKQPLDGLDDPALREKRFNAVSASHLQRAAKELKGDDSRKRIAWAEDEVKITTYAQKESQPQTTSKRFGVFFGISKYQFNDAVKEITEGKWEPNLPCCRNDAIAMTALMRSLGQLDDAKSFFDEQATRQQMEVAITQWLPSVSRPGDTVFIFFAGHGDQVDDDNGDEADGKDEWLLPHDYADKGVLLGLRKLQKEGRLPPEWKATLAKLNELVAQASSEKAAEGALVRATGVTDDLFGHWLQRLAGRHVLVILNSCHSGGMARNEKSVEIPVPPKFDFLDGEVSRLKDLGQPESALFAACNYNRTTLAVRLSDDQLAKLRAMNKNIVDEWVGEKDSSTLSVMPYYLVEGLLSGGRPLVVDDWFVRCRSGMKQYIQEAIEIARKRGDEPIQPYEPVLVKYNTQPIVIKP